MVSFVRAFLGGGVRIAIPLAGLVLLCMPKEADACAPRCTEVMLGDGAPLPASMPGVWISCGDLACPEPSDIELTGPEGLVETVVTTGDFGVWVAPKDGFEAGESYHLEVAGDCSRSVDLSIGPAVPLPASHFGLRLEQVGPGQVAFPTVSGSCSSLEEGAAAKIQVESDPAFEDFAGLVPLVARIDGRTKVIRGDTFEVATLCGQPDDPGVRTQGFGEGRHVVQVGVAVPGFPDLTSNAMEVELECGQPESQAETGGCASGAAGMTLLGLLLSASWLRRRLA